jgi:GxxExxY protein
VRPNEVSYRVIGVAMTVHSALGAGLLESVYHKYLCHEFTRNGLQFQHQVRFAVNHDGLKFSPGYTIDFIVETRLVIEIKSLEKVLPVHRAQLLTYLKLTGLPLGLLLNFKVPHMRDGIHRVINAPEADL